jgi:phage terminase large subunit-like protein
MITKQASGSGKIDPLMAAFNAVALMANGHEPLVGATECICNLDVGPGPTRM